MVVELRLELDRIERSIQILEELAGVSRQEYVKPPATRPSPVTPRRGHSNKEKVVSIEGRIRKPKGAEPLNPCLPETDVAQGLRDLRAQTARFRQTLSVLDRNAAGRPRQ